MTYFFDNDISYRFAAMLRALGVDAVALREEFRQDTPDEEVFAALRHRDVVFLTADAKQRTRDHEARALREAGIRAMFFAPFFGSLRFWDQAAWLVRRWPAIEEAAQKMAVGACGEIKQNGRTLSVPL